MLYLIFLHRRPEPFVKHIYNRLSTAQNIYSENKIKKLELEHTFHVKSEDGTCVYTINFLIANCTCIDYIKFHWPCKHLCAIFLYIPGYSFDDLPEIFLNNPFISPDPRYSITNVHSKEILTKSPVHVLEKENASQINY